MLDDAIKSPDHYQLRITRCSDSLRWYADKIGQVVPFCGAYKSTREYRSVEDAGYINFVLFDDAELEIK